jgi:hypothetical protein
MRIATSGLKPCKPPAHSRMTLHRPVRHTALQSLLLPAHLPHPPPNRLLPPPNRLLPPPSSLSPPNSIALSTHCPVYHMATAQRESHHCVSVLVCFRKVAGRGALFFSRPTPSTHWHILTCTQPPQEHTQVRVLVVRRRNEVVVVLFFRQCSSDLVKERLHWFHFCWDSLLSHTHHTTQHTRV